MSGSGHRSLLRADRIVDFVARSEEPPNLSAIAQAISAPVSSTQDLVRELCALGYLRMTGTRFRMGLRPHVLDIVAGTARPTGPDHAELDRLSRTVRAPVAFAVLVGHEVFYLDHAGPRAPGRIQGVADDHRPRPPLRTAAGRLLLACADAPIRERILSVLRVDDPAGAVHFESEIPAIRRDRVARSDGLADPDIAAIALPAADGAGALVLFASRAPRRGRVPALEAAARRLRRELSTTVTDRSRSLP